MTVETVVDPTTGKRIREVPLDDAATIERKLAAADAARRSWADTSFEGRAAILRAVAQRLRDATERLAQRMTQEMGKTIREGRGEVAKAAWAAEHFADHAATYLAPEVLPSDATESFVQYPPIGPVLGVLPWNSPLWLASRVFSPALMAGNPVLIKHDAHVPGCADDLAKVFEEAGAPPGVFDVLHTDHEGVADLIRDRRIRAVSLTASTRAGVAIGGLAGSEIKPVVLELGGSDPCIVLPDADLDAAVPAIAISRFVATGQSCIAAKRLLVHADIHDAFVDRMREHIANMVVGDPADEATDLGPMARADLRDALHDQVQRSVDAGARVEHGGQIPDGPGAFYPPTLLTEVTPDMSVSCEETFGPVAVVQRVASLDEAVRVANDTEYGLAASIWTADVSRARDLARHLEVGQVAINGLVKTDPRLPSGGVKRSGLGRELGPHGIRMFVNAQQVWIGPKR